MQFKTFKRLLEAKYPGAQALQGYVSQGRRFGTNGVTLEGMPRNLSESGSLYYGTIAEAVSELGLSK